VVLKGSGKYKGKKNVKGKKKGENTRGRKMKVYYMQYFF
jgi:hypothetical protein